MNTQETCEHPDCTSIETQRYTTATRQVCLCAQHAVEARFCLWCKKPSQRKGYHVECLAQLEIADELEGEVTR